MVKFQPIARSNAILVVARKPELLQAAATWIARLDGSSAASTGVKVYRVRYGDAKQIAKLLNDLFTGGGGGADTAANQLAPGSGSSILGGTGASGGMGAASTGGSNGGFGSPSSQASAPGGAPAAGLGAGTGAGAGGGAGLGAGGAGQNPFGALRRAILGHGCRSRRRDRRRRLQRTGPAARREDHGRRAE